MIVICIGVFLLSLFLMLRISYRHLLAAVHSTLPTVASFKDTVAGIKHEIVSPKTAPNNSGRSSVSSNAALEARKKELERELEIARKEREQERKEQERKLQESASARHIPIEKKSDTITSKLSSLF